MRVRGIVLLLLSLGLLSGCTVEAPKIPAVGTATQNHSVNRYELHGSPDKVALLVDSETGTVWQYKDSSFEMVPVKGLVQAKHPKTVTYKDGNTVYDIPFEKQPDFLQDHPNAKIL